MGAHRRRNTVRRERFHRSPRQGFHVGFIHLAHHQQFTTTFGGSMKFGGFAARFALVAVCALMTVVPAHARFWQCAPYAREVSGIQIFGNANTWWSQAAGKYERGDVPKVGAVLSFRSSGKMRLGHVAMVASVISDREVLLNHANWSRRGGIEYT